MTQLSLINRVVLRHRCIPPMHHRRIQLKLNETAIECNTQSAPRRAFNQAPLQINRAENAKHTLA